MKSYRYKSWFNSDIKCTHCNGDTQTRQWIIYAPEYKKKFKLRCKVCKKEEIIDRIRNLENDQSKDI